MSADLKTAAQLQAEKFCARWGLTNCNPEISEDLTAALLEAQAEALAEHGGVDEQSAREYGEGPVVCEKHNADVDEQITELRAAAAELKGD